MTFAYCRACGEPMEAPDCSDYRCEGCGAKNDPAMSAGMRINLLADEVKKNRRLIKALIKTVKEQRDELEAIKIPF